jgi:HD-like signal output (HDOD) protein
MQQMKNESALRAIAVPLTELWNRSIAVAAISRLVAARTKVPADEAFLTGLLHGIGKLYIMARAATAANGLVNEQSWMELISGWQASIGKAVLQSWGFVEELCEAVGEQDDIDRRWKHEARLVDVLIASLVLSDALKMPEPRTPGTEGINAFLSIGVTPADCNAILAEAQEQIRQIHEALA